MLRIKRVYCEPSVRDGLRILVDRIWPRGLSKNKAHIHEWRKELAPSNALRKWFGHDPAKWTGFLKRYRQELTESGGIDALAKLARQARGNMVTLVYAAADERHNQAVALKEFTKRVK
ncbi:MAG: uncharacterized protein K0S58_2736 [Nitrospira sp.]|jgi:uncharacterized protein YeaO (DUF488 family)|nr:uncharacterized protein [Nitrospira sp.]